MKYRRVVISRKGGPHLSRSYETLRRGGRLVSYSFAKAREGGFALILSSMARLILFEIVPDGKRAILFLSGTPPLAIKDNAWYRETLTELFDSLSEGTIKTVVGERVPLVQVARAHGLLERAAVGGKIVLICSEQTRPLRSQEKIQ